MTAGESGSSLKHDGFRLPSVHLLVPESSLSREAVTMYARLLFMSCLIVCFWSLSSAAQSSREAEAETEIQAAKQAQAKGDYARAVAGYQAALKLLPDAPALYTNLGIACYYQKQYQRATDALK